MMAMKLLVFLGLALHASAFACEVDDEVSIVADRLNADSMQVAIRNDETLPDSPKMPASLRVIALPSGKVEQRVPVSSDARADEALQALKADGFSIPPSNKWKQATSRKSDVYQTSLGTLKFKLTPTKDKMTLQRTLTFTPKGKKRARTFKNFRTTSKSATETSQVRKVWEAPGGRAILIVFGNCSDEVYAFAP